LDQPNLGEFDFSIYLKSGIRKYKGKGAKELEYLVKKILPLLTHIEDNVTRLLIFLSLSLM
jgi:hypothetical protein